MVPPLEFGKLDGGGLLGGAAKPPLDGIGWYAGCPPAAGVIVEPNVVAAPGYVGGTLRAGGIGRPLVCRGAVGGPPGTGSGTGIAPGGIGRGEGKTGGLKLAILGAPGGMDPGIGKIGGVAIIGGLPLCQAAKGPPTC